MDKTQLAAGWRELSLTVSERLGRPVGVGKVRWAVESSGLRIGRKIGNARGPGCNDRVLISALPSHTTTVYDRSGSGVGPAKGEGEAGTPHRASLPRDVRGVRPDG